MKRKKAGKVGWNAGGRWGGQENVHGEGDIWVHARGGGGMNSAGV